MYCSHFFQHKLGWRLLSENKSLWSRLVSNKYVRRKISFSKLAKKLGVKAYAWRGIALAAEIINKGVRMTVCNGQDTLFWRKVWVGDKPLISLALENLPLADSFKMVQAYWDPRQG